MEENGVMLYIKVLCDTFKKLFTSILFVKVINRL